MMLVFQIVVAFVVAYFAAYGVYDRWRAHCGKKGSTMCVEVRTCGEKMHVDVKTHFDGIVPDPRVVVVLGHLQDKVKEVFASLSSSELERMVREKFEEKEDDEK